MIHVTALQLEVALGRFHRVVSIYADQKYLSVQNSLDVEFLLPLYPPRDRRIQVTSTFLSTHDRPAPAQSVVHLDHLELHDVTKVRITPENLNIETLQGVNFHWRIHPYVVPAHA